MLCPDPPSAVQLEQAEIDPADFPVLDKPGESSRVYMFHTLSCKSVV